MENDAVRLAVLEERIARMEKATDLQAEEYKRRLTELNHAHERQVEDQATYLRRDIYDNFVIDTLKWREDVRGQLALRQGGIMSFREVAFRIVPLLISLVTLAILFFKGVL